MIGHATILALLVASAFGADWSYSGENGPSHWADTYPDCGETKQSPIDIALSDADPDPGLGDITFTAYGQARGGDLINNGHTVQYNVEESTTPAQISGGGFKDTFQFLQLHFHWGTTDAVGSEHLVDSKQYPMEMHLVHYNTKYDVTEAASTEPDGLAVIGVFIQVGDTDNEALKPITDKLTDVKYKDGSTDVTGLILENLLPEKIGDYFRYSGSLTTPACYESVVWTVLNDTISISQAQMDIFRTELYQGTDSSSPIIEDNFRPAQDLNGRKVTRKTSTNGAGWLRFNAVHVLMPLVVGLFRVKL